MVQNVKEKCAFYIEALDGAMNEMQTRQGLDRERAYMRMSDMESQIMNDMWTHEAIEDIE